jgi:hypothetical protein
MTVHADIATVKQSSGYTVTTEVSVQPVMTEQLSSLDNASV